MFEPEFRQVLDPFRIVTGLADAFVAGGGTILREHVSAFEFGAGNAVRIRTHRAVRTAEHVVIAAGAVSNRLTALLGDPGVPLEAGRGYHVTLPDPGFELRHVVVAPEHQVAITPMSMGLRFAGTLEFSGADSAPNWKRADAILKIAGRVFPGIRTDGYTQWTGDRPMMPDSIPVISRATTRPNVFYAFGSGHYGLTQAAVIGRLITEMMSGEKTYLDVNPYRVDRF
jgi:D-amino-acid dehydrogenase